MMCLGKQNTFLQPEIVPIDEDCEVSHNLEMLLNTNLPYFLPPSERKDVTSSIPLSLRNKKVHIDRERFTGFHNKPLLTSKRDLNRKSHRRDGGSADWIKKLLTSESSADKVWYLLSCCTEIYLQVCVGFLRAQKQCVMRREVSREAGPERDWVAGWNKVEAQTKESLYRVQGRGTAWKTQRKPVLSQVLANKGAYRLPLNIIPAKWIVTLILYTFHAEWLRKSSYEIPHE